MRIILLNGSPAEMSHTRVTLDYLASEFGKQGSDTTIVDLKNAGLLMNDPMYHADAMQSPSDTVKDFALGIKDADIVVLATPLYHGSFSGLLKIALDNLDGDAFTGKNILLVSNASGPRNAMQAAQELVLVARTMGGQAHNRLIGTCKADFADVDGNYQIKNQEILKRCQDIAQEMTQ